MKWSACLWAGVYYSVAALVFWLAPAASAQDGWIAAPFTPIQISIAAGHSQIFEESVPVYGLRLSLAYGRQDTVVGVDFGPFNEAESMTGLGVGITNITRGDASGVAHLGLGNISAKNLVGLQFGLMNGAGDGATGVQIGVTSQAGELKGLQFGVLNDADSMKGAGIGVCNLAHGSSTGMQLGLGCDYVEGDFKGFQMASGNWVVGEFTGLQLGGLNHAAGGTGLQLGIVNHAKSIRGLQLGLLNFNENGFLPVFPLFNFGL